VAAATPVSRRGLLTGSAAAAGLIIGAGATEAGNLLTSSGPSKALTPGEDLMREHGVLKRVLLVFRAVSVRLATAQPVPAAAVADGAKIIHDYIEGFHEGLEEGYVFPRLLAAGRETATVQTLLVQHARGRRITSRVQQIVATAGALDRGPVRGQLRTDLDLFVRMYEPHEAREDTVVFPAFREITSARTLRDLGEKFTELETKQFGPDAFDRMVAAVVAAEKLVGIDDLNAFTPPEQD
jgi:hemerythrin-like domain-containing protein